MERPEKYTDLIYLKEFSNGNDEFITKMIIIFLDETPVALNAFDKYLEAKDWRSLAAIAHKVRPSLLFMGIKQLEDIIIDIEKYCSEGVHLERVPGMVTMVRTVCTHAMKELASRAGSGS